MSSKPGSRSKFLLIALLGATLVSGCAGNTAGLKEPVFFPPPPNDPHVQYLMGINDSSDISGKPEGFSLLSTGGAEGFVIKKIGKAYGVTAHNGKLYVSSLGGSQVIIIDFAKKSFDFLKGNTNGPGQLVRPINTAVDKDGNLYVADAARNEVVVYGPDGAFLRTMAGATNKSQERNQRNSIVSVQVYDDLVFVLDNKASEIRVYERTTGEQLKSIGNDNEGVGKNVALPSNFSIDKDGYIYVTNIGRGNVAKYDRDGHFLTSFGEVSDTPGNFSRPKGIVVDDAGWIYVADAGFSNVQVFAEDGKKLLGFFGLPGLPAGSLNLPAGIAVTTDNLPYFQKLAAPGFILEKVVFVVNQSVSTINPTVSVYGIGEMQGKKKKEPAVEQKSKKVQS